MSIVNRCKVFTAAALFAISLPVFADSNSVGAAVDDSVITTKIKAGLAADSVTHATAIKVETNNGVVTLSGTTEADTEAAKAIEIAESTQHVKSVDTRHLLVKNSTQPSTDAYITAKVKGVFVRNNLDHPDQTLPITQVNIETKEGIVYLSGTVDNKDQIKELEKLAKSVEDVSGVKSTLKASQ